MWENAPRKGPGDVAVVLLAAALDEAVRAFGWLATSVLYAFMLSTAVLVFWLFVLAG